MKWANQKILHGFKWILTPKMRVWCAANITRLNCSLAVEESKCKCREVESIGNPAGIGQGTGFVLRERDRDGIGLGHYRLRASGT